MGDELTIQRTDGASNANGLLVLELVHQLNDRVNFSIAIIDTLGTNNFGRRIEAPGDDMHLQGSLPNVSTAQFFSFCCRGAGDVVVRHT